VPAAGAYQCQLLLPGWAVEDRVIHSTICLRYPISILPTTATLPHLAASQTAKRSERPLKLYRWAGVS
jgi:hypothetical protein